MKSSEVQTNCYFVIINPKGFSQLCWKNNKGEIKEVILPAIPQELRDFNPNQKLIDSDPQVQILYPIGPR